MALSYKKIYRRVWGDEYDEVSSNAIWDYILKLRKKIKEVAGDYEYIENVREVGYKFTAPHDK
ncbi:MAG: helix-turn-helix domain-containing protein [Clostridiales bacterium]|nr:helix-turn-helix domain-containing protein [Clostridiales bacterium]